LVYYPTFIDAKVCRIPYTDNFICHPVITNGQGSGYIVVLHIKELGHKSQMAITEHTKPEIRGKVIK